MAITYTATSNPGGLTGTALDGLPIEVTGLTLGTPYTFTVTATADVVGAASAASASVTPVVYVAPLWAWGQNNWGQLGDGTIIDRSSPVQVGSGTKWLNVSQGPALTIAKKTDGTLWAWGHNGDGRLGLGDTVSRSSPVQIGTGAGWSKIATAQGFASAIKTDGTLWSWGQNNWGQLGNGTIINKSSPVQISALTNWSKISAGAMHTHGMKKDGSLWSWGRNYEGQLGINGSLTDLYLGIYQVGTGTTWLNVSGGYRHSIATKSDGTLWTWGFNQYGALGGSGGGIIPGRVGNGTTWLNVCALNYTGFATKTDGTLWAWGYNAGGQCGFGFIDRDPNGNARYIYEPTQVGTGTNWSRIFGGSGHVFATKTDGTLWGWGTNTAGQLGDGTVIDKSGPVQIGALTTWLNAVVSAGGGSTARITKI